MQNILDLSRKVCHVCGHHLKKDYSKEKEWCFNNKCQLCLIEFNIPYEIENEKARTSEKTTSSERATWQKKPKMKKRISNKGNPLEGVISDE